MNSQNLRAGIERMKRMVEPWPTLPARRRERLRTCYPSTFKLKTEKTIKLKKLGQ